MSARQKFLEYSNPWVESRDIDGKFIICKCGSVSKTTQQGFPYRLYPYTRDHLNNGFHLECDAISDVLIHCAKTCQIPDQAQRQEFLTFPHPWIQYRDPNGKYITCKCGKNVKTTIYGKSGFHLWVFVEGN